MLGKMSVKENKFLHFSLLVAEFHVTAFFSLFDSLQFIRNLPFLHLSVLQFSL